MVPLGYVKSGCTFYIFSSPEISSEDTGHLCQSVLQDFSSVLSVDPSSSGARMPALENGLGPQENGHQDRDITDDSDGVISSSLMVKLVVMAIATITRLQSKGKLKRHGTNCVTWFLLWMKFMTSYRYSYGKCSRKCGPTFASSK